MGYTFEQHVVSTSGPNINTLNAHEIFVSFDHEGFYPFDLYLNCNQHSIIRNQIHVLVWPNPKPQIIGPDAFCPYDSISLKSEPFKQYNWSTGEQTQSIQVKQSGKYELVVTDENGCISSTFKDIILYPEIKGILESRPGSQASLCKYYFVPEDPSVRYTYVWSNGSNADTIETSEKMMMLTVTDSNQCKKPYSISCSPVSNADFKLPSLQIIPNPNNGTFRIISSKKLNQLKIFSSTGMQVNSGMESRLKTSEHEIYFDSLPTGVYIGKAFSEGREIVFKIVVK